MIGGDGDAAVGPAGGARAGEEGASVSGPAGRLVAAQPLPTVAGCAGAGTPPPAIVRRLSNAEYARLARDVLGTKSEVGARLVPDSAGDDFDNGADVLPVTPTHLARYSDAAAAVATEAFATPADAQRTAGCDLRGADSERCLGAFVPRLLRRLLRRAPLADEIAAALELARAVPRSPDPYLPPRTVVEAVLQSPSVLFHVEVGDARREVNGRRPLTGAEIASRLAFMLWRTGPDEPLLDAATAGALDAPDAVLARARAMLEDPRARGAFVELGEQWLRLKNLDGVMRDRKELPLWTDALARSMREETRRLVDDVAGRAGADFLDLLTTRVSFINPALAGLYGVAAPAGTASGADLTRIEFRDGDERAGVLTHASVLTLTAGTEVTTPIYRGIYVREVLLCQATPPPPADVPEVPAERPGQTARARLEEHRTSPACRACHERFDALGFGLERFDTIGARRDRDKRGVVLTGEGTLIGAEPPRFTGGVELGQRVRALPDSTECLVRRLFRFGVGQREADAQSCGLKMLAAAAARDGRRLPALVGELVRSDLFRYVRVVDAASTGGQP